jgi:Divergent InlB B-repeat domain
VQVTATAAGSHEFSDFTGSLTGSSNPQNLVMSAPHSVTADFAAKPKSSARLKADGTNGQ